MKSRFFLPLILAATLSVGCATPPETPAQKVFVATSAYDVALTAAVAYKKLPSCELPTATKICSDKAVIVTLQKADTVAFEALSAAQVVVRTSTVSQSALQTAVIWAQEAVATFNKIVSGLQTKESK